MKKLLFAFIFSTLPLIAYAQNFTVKSIVITGNTKTRNYVILNELGFRKGDLVYTKVLEESAQRLRNINLFSEVQIETEKSGLQRTVIIKVEERWTTIPIFKVASGGGVRGLTIGVYDPNILGKFLELGGQYERLEGRNSGVVWFKNPRIGGFGYGIDVQAWKINKLRTLYDQTAESPVSEADFFQTTYKFYLGFTKDISTRFKITSFYEYNGNQFEKPFSEVSTNLTNDPIFLLSDSKFHFFGLTLDYGRLDYRNYLIDGNLLSLGIQYGVTPLKQEKNFFQQTSSWRYYKTLFQNHTFAQRFMFGGTNSENIQYRYYLGGLDRIRGFADDRFSGKYYWLSNTEYRIPVFENKYVVLQVAQFLDLATTSQEFRDLDTLQGASVGVGLRIVLPKVYRFVARIDYAHAIKRKDDNRIGFGVQQFF